MTTPSVDHHTPWALILSFPEVARYPFDQPDVLEEWFNDGVQRSYWFRNRLWRVPGLKYEAIDGFFQVVNRETGEIHEIFNRAFLVAPSSPQSTVSIRGIVIALSTAFKEPFLLNGNSGTHLWTPSMSGELVESESISNSLSLSDDSEQIEVLIPLLRAREDRSRFKIERRDRQAWGFFEALSLYTKCRRFNGRVARENEAERQALREYNSELRKPIS